MMMDGGHYCPPSSYVSRYGRIWIEKPGAGLGL